MAVCFFRIYIDRDCIVIDSGIYDPGKRLCYIGDSGDFVKRVFKACVFESLFSDRDTWTIVGKHRYGFFSGVYYVTTLMGLPETSSVLILAISIAGSLVLYPAVNKWAKKKGKRLPIIWGCLIFSVAEIIICFSDQIPGNKMVMACLFALFVSFPFAVLNVLPASMMADIIQYDTITSGINQEGIFGAARSFIVKMGNSLAIMIVPSLTVIGAAAGENVGKSGLKWTAAAGALFCLAAVAAFGKYKEGEVLDCIREQEQK